MKNKLLFAALLLTGTTNLLGQHSEAFAIIQNEHINILKRNQRDNNSFLEKRDKLATSLELTNVIDSALNGIQAQMTKNKQDSSGLYPNVDYKQQDTINLYAEVAHQKMENRLLQLKTEISDILGDMLSRKAQTQSTGYFGEYLYIEVFSSEINTMTDKHARFYYEKASRGLQNFCGPNALIQLKDNVYSLLLQVLHITNPKNYAKEIKEAIEDGLAAIEREKKEGLEYSREFDALQKEFDEALLFDNKASEESEDKLPQIRNEFVEQLKQDRYNLIEEIKEMVGKNYEAEKAIDAMLYEKDSIAAVLEKRSLDRMKEKFDDMMRMYRRKVRRAKTADELLGDTILGRLERIWDKADNGIIPTNAKSV